MAYIQLFNGAKSIDIHVQVSDYAMQLCSTKHGLIYSWTQRDYFPGTLTRMAILSTILTIFLLLNFAQASQTNDQHLQIKPLRLHTTSSYLSHL